MTDFIPLPQGAGYAVVVGLGAVFAVGMVLTTYVLKRYNKEIMTAEEFATAGRSVKTGLISAAVVSSWTWAATLLTSTTQVYNNGISGGFFYAAGATCQITLFACLAIKGKEKAPGAHTYLEIVKARYGTTTHLIYVFWGLATNILVTAMLLTGGSAVVGNLTGMHDVAACLLLPLGVVVYTLFGGIKATFLTDYVHTIVLIVIIIVFAFTTFATSSKLGSPGAVWEIITKLAETQPREGNAGGSYLTLHSRSGGIFFVINIVGNFGTVFLDNGYFNKAFAANPAAALPGYVLGSLAWFAVPCLISVTMGLAALSLEGTDAWPTAHKMTPQEVASGLVLPNAAVALLGTGGAVASLLMVFMAVTSAMSAELIATSTIFTYDIYRSYINPQASGKKLIWVSHISVIAYAYVMAGFAIGLYYAGISMGYLYELMGIIIGGAVLSSALCLLSRKQNVQAAIFTPPIATGLAIMSWLIVTKKKFGSVTYENTFEDDAMLTGNVVALCSPLIIIPIFIFAFKPQNFDWDILKTITRVDESEEILEATHEPAHHDEEKVHPVKSQISVIASEMAEVEKGKYEEEELLLHNSFKWAAYICVGLTLCLLILWPMPMYGTKYIFSERFFTGWIVVLFIWIFFSVFMVIIYPVYEGREGLFNTMRGIYWDLTGQTWKLRAWQDDHPEKMHAVMSQVSAQLLATSQSQVYEGKTIHNGAITPRNIDDEMSDIKKDSM
ncbi:urea active transport protein [Scheffersomyces xylosifermentans]|uniref:urea active transport protein n=1 Tax=Scheffersomyces xylosifermentans TaxID=1304137 RepID=UPI00315D1588